MVHSIIAYPSAKRKYFFYYSLKFNKILLSDNFFTLLSSFPLDFTAVFPYNIEKHPGGFHNAE